MDMLNKTTTAAWIAHFMSKQQGDPAEPMSKDDTRRRRLEGENTHLVETGQLLRATINRNFDDIIEGIF